MCKVRASWHSNELRLFHIDNDGIQIDEMLPDHVGLLGGRPRGSTPVACNRAGNVIADD